MERRSIIALVLSLGILFFWSTFLAPKPAEMGPGQGGKAGVTASTTTDNTDNSQGEAQDGEPVGQGSSRDDDVPPPVMSTRPEVETVVEKPGVYKAVFTSKGARLKSFELLDSRYTEADNDAKQIDLVSDFQRKSMDLPLGLSMADGLKLSGNEDYVVREHTADKLVYEWKSPDGQYSVEKHYSLSDTNYLTSLDVVVKNNSGKRISIKPSLVVNSWSDPSKKEGRSFFAPVVTGKTAVAYVNDAMYRENSKDLLKGPQSQSGQLSWVGIDEQYFLLAAFPQGDGAVLADAVMNARGDGLINSVLRYPSMDVGAGDEISLQIGIFAGPKDIETLKALNSNLDSSIDFGWFGFLSKPMLWLMQAFQSVVGNWGLAIIMLTIVIKLLLHPITKKSFASMKEMGKVRPKMTEIQTRYADDRMKQNEEMMKLFKEHKINPMGGCLPMLLQLPVWIALYRTIFSSVDLYNASLGLWIQNLAAPDPYFILPVLLGVLTFLQQKLTPAAADAAQMKMMLYLMPVMMTVFMLFLPSGLVLYILANTILTIGQQWFINRKSA